MAFGISPSSIGFKLPLVMSALVAATVAVMTYLAYAATRDAIVKEADAKLESVASLQIKRVSTLLEGIDRDLRLQALNPTTASAIQDFSAAFDAFEDPEAQLQAAYITDNPNPTGEKDKLYNADTGSRYDDVHAKYHPAFHRLQQEMGYYDIFLFDMDGNLVYTVFKELDYATNILTGEWRESGLGTVFRAARTAGVDDPAVFDDFKPYAPSFGAPAAFIARPVFGVDGTTQGVIVYQMPVDELSNAVADVSGLGVSGEAFLVGSDQLMRSDSIRSEDNDILATAVQTEAAIRGLNGEQGLIEYVDVWGEASVGFFAPIEFLGTTWAIVVKEDVAEIFAQLQKALIAEIINGGGLFLFALVVTIFVSRNISRPLAQLATSVDQIRHEQFDTTVPATQRKDEIGGIANAVDQFRQGLAEAAEASRDASFKSATFEASGAPMIIVGQDLVITQFNRAAKSMLAERADDLRAANPEFDAEALIGKSIDVIYKLPAQDRENIVARVGLPFRRKIPVGEAYLGLLIDEVCDNRGNHIGYVLEWRDQTYQMMTQTVMESIDSQQCRISARKDGTIKQINDAAAEAIGMTKESALGRTIWDVVSVADQSEDPWAKARTGEASKGDFRLGSGDSKALFEGNVSPIPDQNGDPNGFLFMGVDVTEAREEIEAAEALRSQMEAAQTRVVQELSVNLQKLSGGDLTVQIEDAFTDDYEELRKDFNLAISELLTAMQAIVYNSDRIDNEAESISTAVTDLSRRTENQASTLEETATAVEQLTKSVRSAAAGAKDAAEVALRARANAEDSGEVVEQAVSAMNEIETSSNEISKIIGVIDDIAFQTNLLALNAGVEAARAGEAGRGFAVVASEVRALAQRSLEAAAEINALITASGEQVKRGVSLVGEAGNALRSIVGSVAEISSGVNDIAASAEEQSGGLAEINAAMGQLDEVTQNNAAMAEETTAASQTLANEAQVLAKTTSKFNIGEEREAPSPATEVEKAAPKPVQASKTNDAPKPVVVAAVSGSNALDEDKYADWHEF